MLIFWVFTEWCRKEWQRDRRKGRAPGSGHCLLWIVEYTQSPILLGGLHLSSPGTRKSKHLRCCHCLLTELKTIMPYIKAQHLSFCTIPLLRNYLWYCMAQFICRVQNWLQYRKASINICMHMHTYTHI